VRRDDSGRNPVPRRGEADRLAVIAARRGDKAGYGGAAAAPLVDLLKPAAVL
jgi:hypothetical protein